MIRWIKLVLICTLVLFAVNAIAQKDRKYIRQGNKEFENRNYENSEISYRKAADLEKKKSHEPSFNVGDALYKQEKYDDAVNQFNSIADLDISKNEKAKIYHNIGNSFLQNNKLKESVEAYKNALRNNPNDLETKYNLAYAQKKLEQQEQQQQQNQDQNKDQDKDQDQKDQNKDQDKQDKQDQNKDQQNKQDQKQDQEQQQQQPQISKEDAERILQALANDEKDTQKKVKEQQAAVAKVKVEKEW